MADVRKHFGGSVSDDPDDAPELLEAFFEDAEIRQSETVMKFNPDDYDDKPIDDDDNPEMTEEDFARGRPFKEVFPELYAKWVSQLK